MKKLKPNLKITAIVVVALAIFGAIYVLQFAYADFVYPGTFIGDTNIGLMHKDEAMDIIKQELSGFTGEKVVIINNDQAFEFTAESLGVLYDVGKTEESLPTLWKNNGIVRGIYMAIVKKQAGLEVAVDEEKLKESISILYTEDAPQNAYLYLNEDTGEIEISSEVNGQTLNMEDFVLSLKNKFEDMDSEAITLSLDTLYPSVTAGDVEPFVGMAKDIFGNTVSIHYSDKSWDFDPNQHAEIITFGTQSTLEIDGIERQIEIAWDDSGNSEQADLSEKVLTTLKLSLDENAIHDYVNQEIISAVETPAQSVVVTVDEGGIISFEGAATDGTTVNEEALVAALELALENKVSEIEVPTMTVRGGVDIPEELQELGITELIATGYTGYSGSPYNREVNIAVGMSKFNGVLVEPGEVFSFLDTLGVVDGSTGYYKELVITNNETKPEYGGGLCQVSSTMFRAMLYGGLPIEARYEHSYAVSYYAYPNGYGLDATIYQPWPDLQFTNDTGGHILIQAYVEENEAYFKFYGTSDGRTVSMDGPYYSNYVSPPSDVIIYTNELQPGVSSKQDSAHTGFDVDWYRTVVMPDGTETTENIHSHYQAWPAKYLVGAPAAEGTENQE